MCQETAKEIKQYINKIPAYGANNPTVYGIELTILLCMGVCVERKWQ